MSGKNYYGAVIDLRSNFGTREEISRNENVIEDRYFNEKFVDSPEKALAVAADVFNKRHKVSMDEIMKKVTYDKKNNEYVVHCFSTTNLHAPTERQMERWMNGEPDFRLYEDTYYIQIYKTELVPENLIGKAKNLEFQFARGGR